MLMRYDWWRGRAIGVSCAAVAAVLGVIAPGVRIARADCCGCVYKAGTSPVAYCEGNDLDNCPVASTDLDCGPLIAGGTCDPSKNVPDSVCRPPAPATATASSSATATATATRTATATATPTRTRTPIPIPNGGACMSGSQCASGLCSDGICVPGRGAPVASTQSYILMTVVLLLLGLWSARSFARRR